MLHLANESGTNMKNTMLQKSRSHYRRNTHTPQATTEITKNKEKEHKTKQKRSYNISENGNHNTTQQHRAGS